MKTRPTSSRLRESLFDICQNYIEGAFFLDLFAGSGAMGFEALSRGAARVVFVENDPMSIRCIKNNIDQFNVKEKCVLLTGDVFIALKKQLAGKVFDIIYADPPYGEYGDQLLSCLANHPILKPNGMLFIEDEGSSNDVPGQFHDLILISLRRTGRASLQQWQKV